MKHPLNYNIEEIVKLINIPIILELINNGVIEKVTGIIVSIGSTTPNSTLPIFINFKASDVDKVESYNIFRVNSIDIIP